MSENKSIISKVQIIEKIFNQYNIKLISKINGINIIINRSNTDKIYEGTFDLDYLHTFKLLISSFTVQDMIKLICYLIDENNIKIEENKTDLKLYLISTLPNHPNVKLNLKLKDSISKNIIQKLLNEIKSLREENKKLKQSFENEINKLNLKINNIENENNDEKKRIEITENKINEIEKKMIKKNNNNNIREKSNLEKRINLKYIKSIEAHEKQINSLSIFPSGNIVSVSADKSIKIFNDNFILLQNINKAHENSIIYVDVKNEKNFVTCSSDYNIKTWIKIDNSFKLNKVIYNAHNNYIRKVLYCLNGNIISCSYDTTIKIWKEKKDHYQNIKILNHSNWVFSILLLEDKKILVSSGIDGTKFWNLFNYKFIFHFHNTFCGSWNGLCRINEDKIIVRDEYPSFSLKIISISKKQIIQEINNSFSCWAISIIKGKSLFLIGGKNKNIYLYKSYNLKLEQSVFNAHDNDIIGFLDLNNGQIASYGNDKKIKIWSY